MFYGLVSRFRIDGEGLIESANRGNLRGVRALLAVGADIQIKDNYEGRTALHWAAAYDHHLIVRELLAAGADINAKTKSGWTALHYAALNDHHLVVLELLTAGADINAKINNGRTALDLATERDHQRICEQLANAPNPSISH